VRFPAFANLLIDYMRVLVTTSYNPGPVDDNSTLLAGRDLYGACVVVEIDQRPTLRL
jgi:hypothetical protein